MKKSKSMIYNFLLFLFIILVAIIYIEYRKKILNNELKNNNQKTIENFASLPKFKITELKITEDNEVKDKTGKDRALHIKGEELSDIKEVFFGNLNGTIVKISNQEIYVLPPNFGKYEKDTLKLNSLEIKFLIKKENTLKDPKFKKLKNNKIVFEDENIQKVDLSTLKSKLKFKINDDETDFNISINDVEYNNFELSDKYIELEFYAPIKEKIIELDIKFMNSSEVFLSPTPSPSESNDLEITISETPEPELIYLFDDLSTLLPSGLYYRHTTINDAGDNSQAWNVYLDEDDNKEFDNDELKAFYEEMKKHINPIEPTPPVKPIKTFQPKNMLMGMDEENDTILVIKWDKPSLPLTDRFTYVLNIVPLSRDENDKLFENDFKMVDEKIHFEKNEFKFPMDNMIPMHEYDIVLQVFSYENSKLFEKADTLNGETTTTYKFTPDDIALYHKHVFKDGKFDTTLTQSNPELLQTYAELNAYNKMKTQEDLLAAGDHLKASSECMANSINNLNTNKNMDSYDAKLQELLKKDQEEESSLFRIKQDEQQTDLDRLNNKIAILEDLQGKANLNKDTRIKNIKSMNDGTDLGLINLENNKRLVKLNKGCLTVKQNGDYGYIPCNLLDQQQHFNLSSINNLDEYNNLLLMNNNAPLDENQNKSVEYPFYIMQPSRSIKCVNVENGKLSVKPCNQESTSRFRGDFVEKSCDN